ncbi:MAG: RDD family protein [Chloroflexi bacterium]|nr:RDD family protein [Chloroflexota bacterium]
MTQTCPQCAAGNPSENRFCTHCGQSLTIQTSAIPSTPADVSNVRKVCAGCRTVNQAEAAYCYRCGLKLPDQLHSRAEAVGNPAGFWIRLGASVIDGVLLLIASVLTAVFLTRIEFEQALGGLFGGSDGWATTVVTVTNLTLGVGYYTVATAQWGRTIGKAILGLKVTRVDGSRLSYQRSFARYWSYVVSAIPLGFGFVAIALSSQKRGWHDFICDTRVVNLRS